MKFPFHCILLSEARALDGVKRKESFTQQSSQSHKGIPSSTTGCWHSEIRWHWEHNSSVFACRRTFSCIRFNSFNSSETIDIAASWNGACPHCRAVELAASLSWMISRKSAVIRITARCDRYHTPKLDQPIEPHSGRAGEKGGLHCGI